MAKGEPASPPPRPKGATPCPAPHWPNGAPHTGHPTALRTAHRGLWPPPPSLATYGPLTGHPGRPPTGQRGGPDWPKGREGEPMATRELQPPTSRPPMAKGEPHTSLASHWPQRGGHRREAFAPPLTGHPGGPLPPPLATMGRGRLRPAPDLREATGSLPPTGHLREPKTDLAK